MFKEYLRYVWRSAHDPEYKFFSNFNFRKGTCVIVGYNEGKNITSFRYFNEKYRIVQFERDPFLQARIAAMGGIAGSDFEVHLARLGSQQCAQTLFVPRVRYKRIVEQATFESDILKDDKTLIVNAPPEEEKDSPFDHEMTDDLHSPQTTAPDGVDQIVVETKLFDSYRINSDIIIIDAAEFSMDPLTGMTSSLARDKPILMLPNTWPVVAEANQFLAQMDYRAYVYNPKRNTVRPVGEKESSTNIFFIHRQAFEATTETKL